MDILEFAMKMELDGKAFYDKQARESSSEELGKIFHLLAEEEERHYQFFKSLKDGDMKNAEKQVSQSRTLTEVKNLFVVMSEKKENKSFGDDEITAWTKALEIEEKAESFYREKATEESDPVKKDLLTKIAEEEQNHIHMIDGVLTYLKFPDTFADSSEFKNFQSLEGH